MDLSDVHFTKQDVQEFMDSLDIDAILFNLSLMPPDSDGGC